jgi:TPR repeat protein
LGIGRTVKNRRLQRAKELSELGRNEEALSIVFELLKDGFNCDRAEVVGILASLARTNGHSRLNYARALIRGDGCNRDLALAQVLLSEVVAAGERGLSGEAEATLGELYCGELPGTDELEDRVRALAHFERGAELMNAGAAFRAAVFHEHGRAGQPDLARAAALYRQASDFGLVEATHNLAGMILMGNAAGTFRDAMALYEQAVAAGDVLAPTVMAALERFVGADGTIDERGMKEFVSKLRDAVETKSDGGRKAEAVPPSMARPNAVWKAIVNALGTQHRVAQHVTALLYGADSWLDLERKVERGPAAPFDEDCDRATVDGRRNWQTEALSTGLEMPLPIASRVAGLLAATSSLGTPSLRNLDKAVEDAERELMASVVSDLAKHPERILEAMDDPSFMHGMMEVLGLEAEAGRARELNDDELWMEDREISDQRRDIWYGIADEHGWDILPLPPSEEVDFDVDDRAVPWGFAFSDSGRRFDVRFETTVGAKGKKAFMPSEGTVDAVERAAVPAVVFYERPMVWLDKRGSTLLLGGSLYMDGAWSSFCLDEDGLDGAIAQRGSFAMKPNAAFAATHSMPCAMWHASQMAYAEEEPEPIDTDRMEPARAWRAIYVAF